MKSWERVFDILKEEMKAQLREELLEEFKLIAREVFNDQNDISSGIEVKEYMHMKDFLQEYKIGRSLFFKIRKQNYFDDHQQGKFKVYNVGQFREALRKYNPLKPKFK
ncbi:MAG: hypothetical protein JST26_09710 [Bacteroidetes bacterium]|nr:hypothetical protein [Bacteroidota bacterium]